MNLIIAVVLIFLVINLILGLVIGRNIKTIEHYSVGRRAFGKFAIFATLSASFIGGGYTMGNASKVFSEGLVYAFALLGFSLQEILVALLVAPRMGKYQDCLSIGDIIERRYGRRAKIATGFFAVLICMGILGAQVGALSALFSSLVHMSSHLGVFLSFAVIIIYCTLGGMRAVVYTDILQFMILIIGIPLTFFVGLHYIGGFSTIVAKVPREHLFFLNNAHNVLLFISLFITFSLGEALVPPYTQRLFMAKTVRDTKIATLCSGLMSIPFFIIVGAIGLVAFVLNPQLEPNLALPYVVQETLPPLLKAFVIAGILSIIMSSASGFLNAASVSFINDIVRPFGGDRLGQAVLLRLAKMVTVVVGVGAMIFALSIKNILDILLHAYDFWAPVILVPLLATIFNFKAKPRDFFVGAGGGVLAMLIWTHLPVTVPISGIVVGVLCNLVCFSCSRWLGRRSEMMLAENRAVE